MARENIYFIVTPPGLEQICAGEVRSLGIEPLSISSCGLEFAGGLRELYLANLWLRSASRILVRLGEISARDFPSLFQKLAKLPWGRFVKPGQDCRVSVSCHSSRLNHSGRIADTCRKAIVRALGQDFSGEAEVRIYLRFVDDRCQVSVDSSGEHLHRRGYRQAHGAAPLRETLAAGCLLACGYDGRRPLIDLMTGSGTFALEAAMIALNRAPGLTRSFTFMDWPKFRPGLWQQVCDEAVSRQHKTMPASIVAVDSNPKAIAAAEANLVSAGVQEKIDLRCCAMQELEAVGEEGLLICNPPYGERIGRHAALTALYRDLGHVYGQRFSSWRGAILCPDGVLLRATRLPMEPLLRLSNGGIRVGLFRKKS